jgi:hypothetical protein
MVGEVGVMGTAGEAGEARGMGKGEVGWVLHKDK